MGKGVQELQEFRSGGVMHTGWKPMLHCFPESWAISQSYLESYFRGHGVTRRRRYCSIGF
jgi:hypothetical protein